MCQIRIILDCDGVILNSNRIKTEAFGLAVERCNLPGSQWITNYNIANGGMTRQEKFKKYLEVFELPKDHYLTLMDTFAEIVTAGLENCEICSFFLTEASTEFVDGTAVVSGGAENEMKKVFRQRGIEGFFGGGVYGNPRKKIEILSELQQKTLLSPDVTYYGDSRLDFEVCRKLNISFKFIWGWSEFDDWKYFFSDKKIDCFENLTNALHGS